jgi:hypothetical protein
MSIPLLNRITCPHCWESSLPEELLRISCHENLLGDLKLGKDYPRRFLPSRFSVRGDALDAFGLPCPELACPHCHLSLPRASLEMEPLFISIIGTPSSGKSFYLVSLTECLNRFLPQFFAVNFSDVDIVANGILSQYREKMFRNRDSRSLQPLKDLIPKTDAKQYGHFDNVSQQGVDVEYPRPFLFGVSPSSGHRKEEDIDRISRLLCLYDIAGELCLPGSDSFKKAATHHLACSHLLLFVYDPLQDIQFRKGALNDDASLHSLRNDPWSQDTILEEMANRIRDYRKLQRKAPIDVRLMVVVTKSDSWRHKIDGLDLIGEPFLNLNAENRKVLDVPRIQTASLAIQELLLKHSPSIVNKAQAFSNHLFVPVTSLGFLPKDDPRTNLPSLEPCNINPNWVTAPLLMVDELKDLVPRGRRQKDNSRSKESAKVPPG